jgi:hypothetical protein
MQGALVLLAVAGVAHRLAVDRDHPLNPLGACRHVSCEAHLEGRGIKQPEHPRDVSWLGMPPGSRRKRRNSASVERPNSAMSTQVSALLTIAKSATITIPSSSCRYALPRRGSTKSAKHPRKPSMLPSRKNQTASHELISTQKVSTILLCDSPVVPQGPKAVPLQHFGCPGGRGGRDAGGGLEPEKGESSRTTPGRTLSGGMLCSLINPAGAARARGRVRW